jgi:hypothetical protein
MVNGFRAQTVSIQRSRRRKHSRPGLDGRGKAVAGVGDVSGVPCAQVGVASGGFQGLPVRAW